MSEGIIYQLSGPKSAELCVVSLASLRQVYDGSATIFITPDCKDIGELIARDRRLNVRLHGIELPNFKFRCSHCGYPDACDHCRVANKFVRPHWVAKTFCYLLSPYDYTIYLDSDTVVLENPEVLFGDFKVAECCGLRILDLHPYTNSVRRQFFKFRKVSPVMGKMIDNCYGHNLGIVNNGMLSFSKDHPLLRELHHLCIGLGSMRMHDEIAMQLVLPYYSVEFVDTTWNCVVAYDEQWEHRKVAHYHAGNYHRMEKGQESFAPHLQYALDNNFAQIQQWCGRYNGWLKKKPASN